MDPKRAPCRSWQKVAQETQDYRDSTISLLGSNAPTIPADLPKNVIVIPALLLDQSILQITDLSPEDLLNGLLTGQLSAVGVSKAYLNRAAVAQGLVNCLTELLPTVTLKRAQELDDYYKKYKKPIGPLHGLPISVKEHIGMQGLRCTTGYVSHWDNIAKEDAHILKILCDSGAVFHCRTTVPQTMMHLETDSNLFGVTVNPYNSSVTSGGSSGGEGSLIALRGSCLGIGSDVGGSIRNPAANCGIYGFKPTAFRIPTDGWGYMMAGADTVETVLGPMSTSIFGLKLFMTTIINSQPWLNEPALIPIPWRHVQVGEEATGKRLRIGVMWHDNVVRPHPPIARALNLAQHLEDAAIEVVDFPPYLHEEAWAILSSLYYPDGGEADISMIEESGEPWRPLSEWIIKENPCVKKLSVGELAYWMEEREAYRKEYALHWNKIDVDAVLCPVGPGVAPKHNTAKYWNYTSQWNLLDYPAVAFPVCKVDKSIDVMPLEPEESLSGLDDANRQLWDAEEFHGLPVSLQLVARRFQDEKLLAILEYITAKINLPLESIS